MPPKKKLVTSLFLWVAITLGATGGGLLIQSSSIGTWIEQRTYDLRFAFRGSLPPSPEAPITVLAIDEETLSEIPDPLMLWHRHFAGVIEKLAEGRAAVVGLDFIFSDISRFDPSGQQAFSQALLRSGAAGLPVVLAYRVTARGVEQPPEAIRFAALAVGHSLAYINLTTDNDDFVRGQEIAARSGDDLQSSFPLAVASAYAAGMGQTLPVDADSEPTILINFRGPDHFPQVSFSAAVDAANRGDLEFFEQNFGGRIVLIGRVGERGDEDFHSTPQYYWTDRTDRTRAWRTPGVEIHGSTIATLLEGSFIREIEGTGQLQAALVLVSLVTLLCLRFSPLWAISASVLVLIGFLYTAFSLLFPEGYWLHVVAPVSGAALAVGASQVSNYLRVGREKRYLRSVFKRYVNDAVIEQILASPDGLHLEGNRKRVSVLFADIRGFTRRSEGLEAEVLVGQLNAYFHGMVRAIQDRGGMVDKFIGDGIMALFGAPLDDPDAPRHSVEAALAMIQALDQVNKKLAEHGAQPIRIGIGIHTGDAVVGNMGSPEKMDYTAIGDVVNTASRIESLTRRLDADILISSETFESAGDAIRTKHRGSEAVKGKAELVEVYEVLLDAPGE